MTHEPWQPPTEPWAPDDTETQWVRSGPPATPDLTPTATPTAGASATRAEATAAAPKAPGAPVATASAAPGAPSAATASAASRDFALLRIVGQAACPLLLLAGLTLDDSGDNGWGTYPAWALFALVCAILQLAPVVGRRIKAGMTDETAWFFALIGSVGLAAYWVTIVLPTTASSDAGFLQSLAVWLAVVGAWLTSGRHRPIR